MVGATLAVALTLAVTLTLAVALTLAGPCGRSTIVCYGNLPISVLAPGGLYHTAITTLWKKLP